MANTEKEKKETPDAIAVKTEQNPASKVKESHNVSIEKKLAALYRLQMIDSDIDRIRMVRGELPLEVQDLEDEIKGLETRIVKHEEENREFDKSISELKNKINDANIAIEKYEKQKMNVRNNREYNSISKEIEYQGLEIQLCEKKISEITVQKEANNEIINESKEKFEKKKNDLLIKNDELSEIVKETEKDEKALINKSDDNEKIIEDRLLAAYKRIRKNARNGLAVVKVERDACGGCFNKIPPQRQLDIKMHKKIIVCEYCGRILIDEDIALALEGKPKKPAEPEKEDATKEKKTGAKSTKSTKTTKAKKTTKTTKSSKTASTKSKAKKK